MPTITCENDQWGITNVLAWMDEMRAAGKIPENYALFAKDFAYKQYDHAAHYNSVICVFNGWNGSNKCVVTSSGPSIHVTQVGNSGLSVCGIKGGQVFYVMDRAASPAS